MSDIKVACARIALGKERDGDVSLVVEIDSRYVYEDWVVRILNELDSCTLEELLKFRATYGTYTLSFEEIVRGDDVVYRLGYESLVDGTLTRVFYLGGMVHEVYRLYELMNRVDGAWSRCADRVLVSENAFVGSGFYMQRMSESVGVLEGANASGLLWYVGSSGEDVEAGALHYEELGDFVMRYPFVRDVLVLPEDWMAVFEGNKLIGICDDSYEDRMDVLV